MHQRHFLKHESVRGARYILDGLHIKGRLEYLASLEQNAGPNVILVVWKYPQRTKVEYLVRPTSNKTIHYQTNRYHHRLSLLAATIKKIKYAETRPYNIGPCFKVLNHCVICLLVQPYRASLCAVLANIKFQLTTVTHIR